MMVELYAFAICHLLRAADEHKGREVNGQETEQYHCKDSTAEKGYRRPTQYLYENFHYTSFYETRVKNHGRHLSMVQNSIF